MALAWSFQRLASTVLGLIGLLFGWPAAADDSIVDSNAAQAELKRYLAIVEYRLADADLAFFFYEPAQRTLRAAFEQAGIGPDIIYRFADSWANGGLASDYVAMRADLYWQPRDALLRSIDVAGSNPVRQDEFDTIKEGMTAWMIRETSVRILLERRVVLWVLNASAVQTAEIAEAIQCGADEPCKAARAAVITGAHLAEAAAGTELGENRDELAKARRHFIKALEGRPPAVCRELEVGVSPAPVVVGKRSAIQWSLLPAGCASRGPPSFRVVSSFGPPWFDLDVPPGLEIHANSAGGAVLEGKVATAAGEITRRVLVRSEALPPTCQFIRFLAPKKLHVLEQKSFLADYQPWPCTEPVEAMTFSTLDPEILRTDAPFRLEPFATGIAVGRTRLTARAGVLQDSSEEIEVVNDGPECRAITFHYGLPLLPVGSTIAALPGRGLAPGVSFQPADCRRPDGRFRFTALGGDFADVATDTGALAGKTPGKQRIRLDYGELSATIEFPIVARPACDAVTFHYPDNIITVGTSSAPVLTFATRKSQYPQLDEACEKPRAGSFSSSDPARIEVDRSTGTIKARALGNVVITYTSGPLKAARELTVLRAQ